MMHPPRGLFAMCSLLAMLACLASVALAGSSKNDQDWAAGAREALEDAKEESPDVFDVPEDEVPESMKDIPLAPESPEELARGLKKLKVLLEDGENGVAQDPEVKEKLKALHEKLEELGVADILEGKEASPMEKQIACLAMSARTAGVERQSTLDAMGLMAKGRMNPQQAGNTILWRLVATCIGQISSRVSNEFKKGKHTKLPVEYVKASSLPGEEFAAEELGEMAWYNLRMASQRLIRKMDPDYDESEEEELGPPPIETESAKSDSKRDKPAKPEKPEKPEKPKKSEEAAKPRATADSEGKMPVYFGLLMVVPLLAIFALLGKIFLSMSKDSEDKKVKKKDKKTR